MNKKFRYNNFLVEQQNVQGTVIENNFLEIRETLNVLDKDFTVEKEKKIEIETPQEIEQAKKKWFEFWKVANKK